MAAEFEASKPIYMQIVHKILLQIVRLERTAGEKLPSVREMAITLGVNPNTIQRTYGELERMQMVETKRGQGTFITENQLVLEKMVKKLQMETMELFVGNMQELGIEEEEMIEKLNSYLKKRKEGNDDTF
ncbi:GntR family transcriptional regulator [Niallia nealsonii]|uniref:GntR family transcriptional regulator n=1 Tax=Niallia nealsonii TaxID=115979 RepID=A0A2N0Z4K8_9BACI|nr:GntR family transcriptional regulator [Niallia nealsonii]PKG24442.1 GntR family transcriptional regulator [Niallia nealsonii]